MIRHHSWMLTALVTLSSVALDSSAFQQLSRSCRVGASSSLSGTGHRTVHVATKTTPISNGLLAFQRPKPSPRGRNPLFASKSDGSGSDIKSKKVDTGAIFKYLTSVAVSTSLFALTFRLVDKAIASSKYSATDIPFPAVVAIFYVLSFRSSIFNPLNNERTSLDKGEGSSKDPLKDRIEPKFTPPGVVFPIMWLLVVGPVRAYSSALVFSYSGYRFFNRALISFMFHLSCGDLWNTINNKERRYGASVSAIVLGVLGSAAFASQQYFEVLPKAGNLLSATMVWLAFAAALIIQTWRINPNGGKKEPLYPYVGESDTEFKWFNSDA